ncbi:uncharacterized protein C6orf118 homolog isoform 1 [Mus musculus]|uniref:RIKEN cDNA 1700010I14 gene n=3 Tax=Mus musculus TaxID=10090 RepID=Q3TTN6_MOUSE|nr:uncharacterized protein C6orf118 homolog isoform 1 [Mus musculus]EDL02094.1 RIKEN cDNA 1700010I14, isoform CRA_b [Mus musculus]BAE36289.1 unnamed protein product [Mus musculus]|eukprot:NP_080127.2 uncharacterized protein C6orf118 homolog isoform 1 [Mus musculus]
MAEDQEPDFYLKWKHCEKPGVKTLSNLRKLLSQLQEDHRKDISVYISGHLNPRKLYKPPETIFQHWRNSNRTWEKPTHSTPTIPPASRNKEVSEMKDAWVHFTVSTALHPDDTHNTPLFRYLNPRVQASRALKDGASAALQEEEKELKERLAFSREKHMKEELRLPEMKVLRYPEVVSSRQCSRSAPGRDVYRYISPYLAGITKADSYKKFLSFQREVLAKEETLKYDFTGSKVAVAHENRLKEELQKICTCNPQQFNRLQVFGEIFEDICNSSLIFGDLLKEIKDEYELYMAALLDSQPTAQYQRLLAEVRGLENSPRPSCDIDQAKEHLRKVQQAYLEALEHNDKLRNELEAESLLLQSAKEKAANGKMKDEKELTLVEKVEKRRCEIFEKLDEIKALEKHIKENMVHSGVFKIAESGLKSIEDEAIKLETSNRILKKKIKVIESQMKQLLLRSKISEEERQALWDLIREYSDIEDVEDVEGDFEMLRKLT